MQPEFGLTAGLTALFACSEKARIAGACILLSLEGGYSNTPFAKTTPVTALGQSMGLSNGRLQQLHAGLKIAVPLSTFFANAGR